MMRFEVGDRIHIKNWFGRECNHHATVTAISHNAIFFDPGIKARLNDNTPGILKDFINDCTIENLNAPNPSDADDKLRRIEAALQAPEKTVGETFTKLAKIKAIAEGTDDAQTAGETEI